MSGTAGGRPKLHLELKNLTTQRSLTTAGGGSTLLETPKSTTRRTVGRNLSRFINFFEKSAFTKASTIDDVQVSGDEEDEDAHLTAQQARSLADEDEEEPPALQIQTARATVNRTISNDLEIGRSSLASVKDIIKKFDDAGGSATHRLILRRDSSSSILSGTQHQNAPSISTHLSLQGTLSSLIPLSSAPSSAAVRWKQFEKRIPGGTVVAKVWRRCETDVHNEEDEPNGHRHSLDNGIQRSSSQRATLTKSPESGLLSRARSLSSSGSSSPSKPAFPTSGESQPRSPEHHPLVFKPIDEETSPVTPLVGENSGDSSPTDNSLRGEHSPSHTTKSKSPEERTRLEERDGERNHLLDIKAIQTPPPRAVTPPSTKTKRASHFVALRIDDAEVVDAVKRFQTELVTSAPFLGGCKSNSNKLHLTLLVLSLASSEVERAKKAFSTGVRNFMTAKPATVANLRFAEPHFMSDTYSPNSSSGDAYQRMNRANGQCQWSRPYSTSRGQTQNEYSTAHTTNAPQAEEGKVGVGHYDPSSLMESAFDLEFRTIGAFGTRVLFLSPPLRQRLLLQYLHVELARAFGDEGIPIVGAGSGWNSAMEIQRQVRGELAASPSLSPPASIRTSQPAATSPTSREDTNLQAYAASARRQQQRKRKPTEDTPQDPPSLTPPVPESPVHFTTGQYPDSATALDKALIRQYDLSSARTTLYIPQITLFKISKAAKRSKGKSSSSPANPPKLKLFPRLYHNLVQRVLQSGLPPPRPPPAPPAVTLQSQVMSAVTGREAVSAPYYYHHQHHHPHFFTAQSSSSPRTQSPYRQAIFLYSLPKGNEQNQHQQHSASTASGEWGMAPSGQRSEMENATAYAMSAIPYYSAPGDQMAYTIANGSSYPSRSGMEWTSTPILPQGCHLYFTPQRSRLPPPSQQNSSLAAVCYSTSPASAGTPPTSSYPAGGGPAACVMAPPSSTSPVVPGSCSVSQQQSRSSPRRTDKQAQAAACRRLKVEKIVTTSWLPKPPFGTQRCMYLELLEMSQVDPDGYYRRICRVRLNAKADIVDLPSPADSSDPGAT